MRISDWSSDVCSSDLRCRLPHHEARDIEDVDAEILDDEPIALGEIGLRGIDVEPRSEGEAREEGRADPALVDHCLERADRRSEEHTSELQSLMRNSYAVFCLKKKTYTTRVNQPDNV